MVMLSGLLGFMLLGGLAFLPDVEPPVSEEEEFEPMPPNWKSPRNPQMVPIYYGVDFWMT